MKIDPVFKNTCYLISGKFIRTAISMVLGMLTARYLGPEKYGILNHAAAYTGFFCSLCTLGLDGILVQELTENMEKSGEILGTALILRGISSIISAAVLFVLVITAGKDDPMLQTAVLLYSVGMVVQSAEFLQYWFQSRLQFRITVSVALAAAMVMAGYKLYLIMTGKSICWFASAVLAEQIPAACLLFLMYSRTGGTKLNFSREMAVALLKKSCHFILPGLMVAVYAQTDKIMLGQLTGEKEIGYYTAAGSVCSGWCFVLIAVIESAVPEIVRIYRQNPAQFDRKNRQLYAGIFYLSGIVSTGLCLFADPLTVFFYGNAYAPAAKTLRILTWHTGFSYLGVARNTWIVCHERQRYLIWCYLSAAISNVGLNLLLVPRWGALGAAAASLAAQVVTTLIAPILIPKLRENGKLMLEAIMLRNII